ncbi:hypothetical protein MMC08_008979 [Hypocenomyce scalaris]|nr:hypothetical protein [Hypocenomyce scalaris]
MRLSIYQPPPSAAEKREVNGWMANPVAPGNRKAEEGREDGAASERSEKEEQKRDGEED